MKKTHILALTAVAFAVLGSAPVFADAALATKAGCLACHTVDKKVVGPSYKDVAAKYKGNAKAQAKLEAAITKGGVGAWGQVPMPPQPTVSAKDAKTLAKWVLSQ